MEEEILEASNPKLLAEELLEAKSTIAALRKELAEREVQESEFAEVTRSKIAAFKEKLADLQAETTRTEDMERIARDELATEKALREKMQQLLGRLREQYEDVVQQCQVLERTGKDAEELVPDEGEHKFRIKYNSLKDDYTAMQTMLVDLKVELANVHYEKEALASQVREHAAR